MSGEGEGVERNGISDVRGCGVVGGGFEAGRGLGFAKGEVSGGFGWSLERLHMRMRVKSRLALAWTLHIV